MTKPRKILLQKRETRDKINVTFAKRRRGLFHKATELCILCDAQVALLVSSPSTKKKTYAFGPTSVDMVLDSFLAGGAPEKVNDGIIRMALYLLNEIKTLENELSCIKQNKDKTRRDVTKGCPWANLEEFEKSVKSREELQALLSCLEKLKAKALRMPSNSSSAKYSTCSFQTTKGADDKFTTASATTSDTDISQSYSHDIGEEDDSTKLDCGYDLAGNSFSPTVNSEGNNAFISRSLYNGNSLLLGGDMNGFGHENGMNVTQEMPSFFDHKKKDVLLIAGASCSDTVNNHNVPVARCPNNNNVLQSSSSWSLHGSANVSSYNGQYWNGNSSNGSAVTDKMSREVFCGHDLPGGQLKDKVAADCWTMTGSSSDVNYLNHQGGFLGLNGTDFGSSFLHDVVQHDYLLSDFVYPFNADGDYSSSLI